MIKTFRIPPQKPSRLERKTRGVEIYANLKLSPSLILDLSLSAASGPQNASMRPPTLHPNLDFRITVIGESSGNEVISLPQTSGHPPTRITPPAAYRPEHGFLTTSILYDRMCHILHTCTLNSSSLSACDTPVGLGLNAAA